MYARTLPDKIIQEDNFLPEILILVKGWVVTLGEQTADNLQERESSLGPATRHRLDTWRGGKQAFSELSK